jgi:hypothetical protein
MKHSRKINTTLRVVINISSKLKRHGKITELEYLTLNAHLQQLKNWLQDQYRSVRY